MNKFIYLIFAILLISATTKATTELSTVESVDIKKYSGTWYEIARLPNFFQKKCSCVKVEYTLRDDGKVEIKNQCKNKEDLDEIIEANGLAEIKDTKTNAKLKVSFVPLFKHLMLFAGDYWIIALNENYNYAVIGEPNREYLWIISRAPQIQNSELEKCKKIATEKGYNLDKLIISPEWK